MDRGYARRRPKCIIIGINNMGNVCLTSMGVCVRVQYNCEAAKGYRCCLVQV